MRTSTKPPAAIGTSERVRDAYALLLSKHSGQRQKVNERPYIEHPVQVATDVAEAGFEDEMIVAALLHDIVEDSDVTVAQLRECFGDRVADLVDVMTDTAEVTDYERRKDIHRRRVVAAGPDAAAIFAADKLENVRALRSALAELGEEVAARYDQSLDIKLTVWVADVEMVSGYASTVPYAAAFEQEIAAMRADRLNARPRPG